MTPLTGVSCVWCWSRRGVSCRLIWVLLASSIKNTNTGFRWVVRSVFQIPPKWVYRWKCCMANELLLYGLKHANNFTPSIKSRVCLMIQSQQLILNVSWVYNNESQSSRTFSMPDHESVLDRWSSVLYLGSNESTLIHRLNDEWLRKPSIEPQATEASLKWSRIAININ